MLVKDALKLINRVREEIASHLGRRLRQRDPLRPRLVRGPRDSSKGKAGDAINMTTPSTSPSTAKARASSSPSGGVARLLKRKDLPDDYDPADDTTPTVWEACQHLIKRLTAEPGGVDPAAALYNRLGAAPNRPTPSPAASTTSASRSSGPPKATSTTDCSRSGTRSRTRGQARRRGEPDSARRSARPVQTARGMSHERT